MITLRQPRPVWGIPNMSPFCVKLETYLKMAQIHYVSKLPNFRDLPKGRIPYIEDGKKIIGDSGLIIEHLKKKHGDVLDQNLSELDRARALVLRRMVEEHLYYGMAFLRWSDENSFAHVAQVFKKILPPFIGPLILRQIRRGFLQAIVDQGIGAHTRDEIIELCKEDIRAVSTWLGDQDYYMGSEPTSIDATMYGFLIQSLWVPWESEMKEYTKSFKNLESYCLRMKARYW